MWNTLRICVPSLSRGQASLPCVGPGEGEYAEALQLCYMESPNNLDTVSVCCVIQTGHWLTSLLAFADLLYFRIKLRILGIIPTWL